MDTRHDMEAIIYNNMCQDHVGHERVSNTQTCFQFEVSVQHRLTQSINIYLLGKGRMKGVPREKHTIASSHNQHLKQQSTGSSPRTPYTFKFKHQIRKTFNILLSIFS